MKERWIEHAKKADFEAWSQALGVSPLTARILKNRGIDSVEEARSFLYATVKDLPDPDRYREFSEAADLIETALRSRKRIAVATDFDTDGIFAGQILSEGLETLGGTVFLFAPNRLREGYGLNRRIVGDALEAGCGLLITCDNGIAASDAVAYAKERGLQVLVTDHHEVPFEDRDGGRTYLLPPADRILDLKCPGAAYPYREYCGAGVVLRLVEVLYRRFGIPAEKLNELYEYAAVATIADIVELTGENRILVKEGLKRLRRTEKVPFRALFETLELEPEQIGVYHISFIIAPCFNAVGRLADVRYAFDFLKERDYAAALRQAEEIRSLNELRKEMTETGYQTAEEVLEKEGRSGDRVIVAVLPGVHESVVGIIAGRLKEKYHRPVFVLTESEEEGILKGSGRSIAGYHMADELMAVRSMLVRCGGHAMAAGLSIEKAKVEAFREALNQNCRLTEKELTPVVEIDARAPLAYMSIAFAEELELLEPFGVGNPHPLFARPDFELESLRVLGKNGNVLRMRLSDGTAKTDAVYFGDPETVFAEIRAEGGEAAMQRLLSGLSANVRLAFTYDASVEEFRGEKRVRIVCRNCCRIPKKQV